MLLFFNDEELLEFMSEEHVPSPEELLITLETALEEGTLSQEEAVLFLLDMRSKR